MDDFQKYLWSRINLFQGYIDEEQKKEELTEVDKALIHGLKNVVDELVGAFSEYDLNYKLN